MNQTLKRILLVVFVIASGITITLIAEHFMKDQCVGQCKKDPDCYDRCQAKGYCPSIK